MDLSPEHPVYTISVVAHLLGVHEQTLRQYERLGLVSPCRTLRRTRMYSKADVELLESINYLVKICGVNLAGVKIVVTLCTHHPDLDRLLKQKEISPDTIRQKLNELNQLKDEES
jgi:MerR family transcriptional regulator/heat shock protein HspR